MPPEQAQPAATGQGSKTRGTMGRILVGQLGEVDQSLAKPHANDGHVIVASHLAKDDVD